MSDSSAKASAIPASETAEKALLSCLMQSPELASEIAETVGVDWFYSEGRQILYTAILERSAASIPNPGDLLGLTIHLNSANLMEKVGGPGELAEIHGFSPAPVHWKTYLATLRDMRARRQLIHAANELVISAYQTDNDVSALLADAEAFMQEVADSYQDSRPSEGNPEQPLNPHLLAVIEEIEARYDRHKSKQLAGLPTGLPNLDRYTQGLQAGRVYVVAARPKMGKSTYARQIILHVSKTSPVLLHSLEMSTAQTVEALMVREGMLDAGEIAAGSLDKGDFPTLMQTQAKLSPRKIYVESRPITIHQFAASARRHVRRYKVGLIVMDYIQRLRPHDTRADARTNLTYASRVLADLAIQLKVPIIVLAQLNRDAEGIPAEKLRTDHLKECGAFEEDAAFVGLLGPIEGAESDDEYESPVPGKAAPGVRSVGLNIVAQRFGTTGLLRYVFRGHHYQFGEAAHPDSES